MDPHAGKDASVMIARAQITAVTTVTQERQVSQRVLGCNELEAPLFLLKVSWASLAGSSPMGCLIWT